MDSEDMKMIVIIPAYDPDDKLVKLLDEIKNSTDYKIIVVDDGSKLNEKSTEIFSLSEKYAQVLHHDRNKGKGEAIKTALRYIDDKYIQAKESKFHNEYNSHYSKIGVVVIDSDGQHKVNDMMKVCNALKYNKNNLIIGSRRFKGNIPFRSRVGNIITKYVFKAASGIYINDTQTGLRAFIGSRSMIDFLLNVNGSRYEYEMNVLLECARNKIKITEVPIDTVYMNNNKSSHFNPALDSMRIYKEILKFSCSSFLSFLIDFGFYSMLIYFTSELSLGDSILVSNVGARIISSTSNFYINRKYVFKNKDNIFKTAVKYFGLAIFILIMNTAMLALLTESFIENRLIAKIFVEIILFIASWTVQKLFVFRGEDGKRNDEYIENV